MSSIMWRSFGIKMFDFRFECILFLLTGSVPAVANHLGIILLSVRLGLSIRWRIDGLVVKCVDFR